MNLITLLGSWNPKVIADLREVHLEDRLLLLGVGQLVRLVTRHSLQVEGGRLLLENRLLHLGLLRSARCLLLHSR